MRPPQLVLASASPRRQALLFALGVQFISSPADLDESPSRNELPVHLARRLATAKAVQVATRFPADHLILASDTVVARHRRVFGKPVSAEEATMFLTVLGGRWHRVITAIALAQNGAVQVASLTARVALVSWSQEQIRAYVASGDPYDKAGGYAVQNDEYRPVLALRGCRCSVMGLPIALLATELIARGYPDVRDPETTCPFGAIRATCWRDRAAGETSG
jgi:MAF protein